MTCGGRLTQCINFTKKGHNGFGKIGESHSEIVKTSHPNGIIWLAKNQSCLASYGRDLSQMTGGITPYTELSQTQVGKLDSNTGAPGIPLGFVCVESKVDQQAQETCPLIVQNLCEVGEQERWSFSQTMMS